MGINFWCAGCGQPLAADDTDAGREVECTRCRAVVRVPRNPALPAVDADGPGDEPDRPPPAFAVADVAPAVFGLHLLGLSYWLFLAAAVPVAGVSAAEAFGVVPAGAVGTTVGVSAIGAVLAGCALRVVGYARLRPVGVVIEQEWALSCGTAGALLFTAGMVVALYADFLAATPLGPTLDLLAWCGLAAAGLGFVLELVVLAFYRHVLAETLGPAAARWVREYLFTLVATAFAVPVGVVGFVFIVTGIGGFRAFVFGNPAWLPVAPELVFCVFTGGLAATVVTVVLTRQYLHILSRCRAGLAAAARPGPEPMP